MSNFLLSLIIGLGAAIIDVIPMVIKKLDRMFIFSAFSMWVVVGIIVPKIDFSKYMTVNGLAAALLLFVPISFLIYKMDRNAMVQVVLTTIILGAVVGYVSGVFIK